MTQAARAPIRNLPTATFEFSPRALRPTQRTHRECKQRKGNGHGVLTRFDRGHRALLDA